jgi:hypothetical protein
MPVLHTTEEIFVSYNEEEEGEGGGFINQQPQNKQQNYCRIMSLVK